MGGTSEDDTLVTDMSSLLGVGSELGALRIGLYFPDKDSKNNEVTDLNDYILGCMLKLANLTRGVTRLPVARGLYRPDPDAPGLSATERHAVGRGEADTHENTTVVYSYIFDPTLFFDRFNEVREAFYQFGTEANQDELFLEFAGEGATRTFMRAYRIPRAVFAA